MVLAQLRTAQSRVLKIVLVINAVMFLGEIVYGWVAHSSALMADSLDMLGDALVYGFTLFVLERRKYEMEGIRGDPQGRSHSAFGLGVLIEASLKIVVNVVPQYELMGAGAFGSGCDLPHPSRTAILRRRE